jgi:N,N'-diacetyllegionaminate synthase
MNNKIGIIAEIAQGYEGNTKLTELLTTGAIESSADAVKSQLVFADELATPDYNYYDLFKSLEMSTDIVFCLLSAGIEKYHLNLA